MQSEQPTSESAPTESNELAESQSSEEHSSPDGSDDASGRGQASRGQAPPIGITLAGLAAGVLLLVSLLFFPFFQPAIEAYETQAINPTAEELETQLRERVGTDVKNAATVGMLAGLAISLLLGFVEAVNRRFQSSLAPLVIGIPLSCGLGWIAGAVSQSFQHAFRLSSSLEPLVLAVIGQGLFWGIIGMATGILLGSFTGSIGRGAGIFLRAVLGGVLFVLVYVPLAAFFFPMDDSEKVVPQAFANQACWSLLACTILALTIGLGTPRKQAVS